MEELTWLEEGDGALALLPVDLFDLDESSSASETCSHGSLLETLHLPRLSSFGCLEADKEVKCTDNVRNDQRKRKDAGIDEDARKRRRMAKRSVSPESGSASSSSDSNASLSAAELKKQRKRERNRQLAFESRERKKAKMHRLEKENEELKERVKQLESEVARLQASADKDKHAVAVQGTKFGTAAMALTMSMVVLTDSSTDTSGSSGSFEMISFWALGLDLLYDTGIAFDLLLPHLIALIFGTTLTFAFIATYYFRVLQSKRPMFVLPSTRKNAQFLDKRKLPNSSGIHSFNFF